ncbi:YihY/virulence factor BrkB family protein [Hephaestia mangrovi]|uniref:YihY/virulence factor BrkB family protein n=1 Tax=Hephaestia mangrovi TaxID=2873268 RepID=UPI001CA76F90|nr:YihY/virulence factor BrkB family protein [Hephaestia mangrovi]MBY8828686.1 YihY/virulence factor BrkB family protein [Hephaestia mangrovi]
MPQDISPVSPEERRRLGGKARIRLDRQLAKLKPGSYAHELAKRVLVGTYADGFIHAGNLAYLSLLTLFPFFIVAAAVARLFGASGQGAHTVEAFLHTVPPSVANVLAKPIADVLAARSGALLWFGALVGLWTTASFIETIRDILRRAYGVKSRKSFWQYRLTSIGLIIVSVILTLVAFGAQVILLAVAEFIARLLPLSADVARLVSLSRLAPGVALFVALYLVFYSLTPSKYRYSKCPKWPGALLTTVWWVVVTALLPPVLSMLGSYSLTYGSLAGVMIALIFFFFIGLGLVMGAHLNAALAEDPDDGLEEPAGGATKEEPAT